MRDLFPRAGFMRTGYHFGQVDEFFERARAAYERPDARRRRPHGHRRASGSV